MDSLSYAELNTLSLFQWFHQLNFYLCSFSFEFSANSACQIALIVITSCCFVAKNKKESVFFFTQRNRRCGLKYWRKRKVGAKSWKYSDQPFVDVTTQMPATDIRHSGREIIGLRRTLIYFNGEEKTNWRMHEYIIPLGPMLDSLAHLKSDTWVLCKTFCDVEESDDPEDEQSYEEESENSEDELPHNEEPNLSVESAEHPPPVLNLPDVHHRIHWPAGITSSQDPVADMVVVEAFDPGLIPCWHSNIFAGFLRRGAITLLQMVEPGFWRAYPVSPHLLASPANTSDLPDCPHAPPPSLGSVGSCNHDHLRAPDRSI
ncbi:uncharacterized protein LOC120110276 [Phoenix dactylifera]|uniref:Uncharacterized protein LOC120110276 n=1 Tax=Phoenix dactylifera TaxID=42345 RepID=A0A8B9A9Z5_PHODC|nr:uncharacterized protein LOC120110276 [Phoenix dactylifera]